MTLSRLRDSRLALMSRATFLWLFDIGVASTASWSTSSTNGSPSSSRSSKIERRLDPPAGSPAISPGCSIPCSTPTRAQLAISQEEFGSLAGISRQMANTSLKLLESKGLLRVEHGGITAIDLERLSRYGG